MDCVLILFGRKLELVKPDYEHQFLTPSWLEALKVTLWGHLIRICYRTISENVFSRYLESHMFPLFAFLPGHG